MNNTAISANTLQSTNVNLVEVNQMSPMNYHFGDCSILDSPFTYYYPKPAGIGQKILYYQQPTLFGSSDQGSTSFFDKYFIFPVPKGQGFLAQCVIEIRLTSSGDNTNAMPRLASRVFSNVYFETTRGPCNVFQGITPDYTNARLDTLNKDQQQIELSTDPRLPWTGGTTTVFLPCFFQFSENTQTFIGVDACEQLQVRCITNTSLDSMGLVAGITDWAIRCQFTFYDMIYKTPTIARTLLITDVYYEPPVLLVGGSTSVNIPVTCPFPTFCMMILIRDNLQNYVRCDSFVFYSGDDIVCAIDRTCNYSLVQGSTENNQVGSLTYWFSVKRDRTCNQIANNMKDLYGKNLTVTYDMTPSPNYSLYVMFEYFDQLYITPLGQFVRQLQY